MKSFQPFAFPDSRAILVGERNRKGTLLIITGKDANRQCLKGLDQFEIGRREKHTSRNELSLSTLGQYEVDGRGKR